MSGTTDLGTRPVPGFPGDRPSGSTPVREGTRGAVLRAWLRSPLAGQVLRFTAVGIVCTVASISLYALLRPSLGPQWANLLALVSTSVLNTALNRAATFGITDRSGAARDQFRGLLVMGIAWVITASSLLLLHWVQSGATVTEELWTTTLAGFVATAVRFVLFRQWIFRRAIKG
ncbi:MULTISPECIES: GtrA family protein [Arthrobacter]|uniref:GtrA family protein n=2 Tax=Arthrobacter TaxID=1663 RepID=A0ABU9KRI6_9MICC|nr:GtrA family protein [Arthrobacter sp. YJM1]MDP5228689.1 GtrA family protein [Arthrobacter sp. YJM1]